MELYSYGIAADNDELLTLSYDLLSSDSFVPILKVRLCCFSSHMNIILVAVDRLKNASAFISTIEWMIWIDKCNVVSEQRKSERWRTIYDGHLD